MKYLNPQTEGGNAIEQVRIIPELEPADETTRVTKLRVFKFPSQECLQ